MHHRAVGDDAEVTALFYRASLAERNRKIGPGMLRTVVRLAVEMLVLEEHHRIVAADGRAQKTRDVQRRGRHHHPQAWTVGKNRFSALAVIHTAAGEVAADGHANDHRRFERPIRTPAHHAQLIANLHHGRPDVVEELDFRDGLQAAYGHPQGAPDDAGFRERGIENPVVAVFALQSRGGFEDAALPLHVPEVVFAAGVSDVFAENGDALVARHLVGQCQRHHFNHGLWRAVQLGFRFKCSGRRIHVRRIHIHSNRIDGRLFGGQRQVGGLADFMVDFRFQALNPLLIENAFPHQKKRKL